MNTIPIYACFFPDGEIIGFTKTPEEAVDWAHDISCNGKSLRILKIYEITPRYNLKESKSVIQA